MLTAVVIIQYLKMFVKSFFQKKIKIFQRVFFMKKHINFNGDNLRLKQLLKKIEIDICDIIYDHKINDITDISKETVKNDIYVAIKGHKKDGHQFIKQAILNGAKTIIYESDIPIDIGNINYIKVSSTKKIYAKILDCFYEKIKENVIVVGITGTNGKTSTSTLITSFLEYNNKKCCLIGTNGIMINQEKISINNTTPRIKTIYDMFIKMKKLKIKYLIMEATSISLKELRLEGIMFDYVFMTNFASDHLDYHSSLDDYFYSKMRLLSQLKPNGKIILNVDDAKYKLVLEMSKNEIINYGIKEKCVFQATNIKIVDDLWRFNVQYDSHITTFSTKLIGHFNIYNILATLALIEDLGFSSYDMVSFLQVFTHLDGRMEIVRKNDRMYVIDYAHTYESVKSSLEALKYYNQDIILVIGCGGDRDKTKRGLIADVSCKYANHVIFTSDNPRFEDEEAIILDMIENLNYNNYEIETNRLLAIKKAVLKANKKDIVAILGKGCEEYQIKNNIKYPFNDKDILLNSLRGD